MPTCLTEVKIEEHLPDNNHPSGGSPMNATVAQPIDADPTPLLAIVVKLADEGIPIRAIARSVKISSSELYEMLRDALEAGLLVEIPKDDWPAGTSRSARALFNGTFLETEVALANACARFFKASPLEAAMLAVMLRRNEVTKEQLHTVVERKRQGKPPTDQKIVDVMICKLRKKLLPHDIIIETMWGMGYLIPLAGRELTMKLLLAAGSN